MLADLNSPAESGTSGDRRVLTAAELRTRGLSGTAITRLVARGHLQRVARGVYAVTAAGGAATSHAERLAELQVRYPTAVACLHSAASVLGLSTEEPLQIDLAVPRRRTAHALHSPGVQFHWMTDPIYAYGQTVDGRHGTPLRTFDAAKTVADFCARRHKVGREAYLGILKAYLQGGGPDGSPGATTPLLAAARVCRVESVIRADLAVLRA